MEATMHIGSVLLLIWLVIGGIAAGQRGVSIHGARRDTPTRSGG
jgi:hypothetical protein